MVEQVNKPDTSILVADLGNLTVKSQLKPKETEKHAYVEVYLIPLILLVMFTFVFLIYLSLFRISHIIFQDDYYDKYSVAITQIKMLIASYDQSWREPEVQIRNNLHLIEDFDINLLVKQCIQPSDLSLTTIKYDN